MLMALLILKMLLLLLLLLRLREMHGERPILLQASRCHGRCRCWAHETCASRQLRSTHVLGKCLKK